MNTWENPLDPIETRYQIAVGAVQHRDDIIANLRYQIAALRLIAEAHQSPTEVDAVQFAHIRQAIQIAPVKEPNKQCSNWLREHGQVSPRTCKVCGLFSKCHNEC
jgi:hypothetical protein